MAVPSVSVVIPVYNAAHLVSETLDSVLGQSVQDIEVIVVDDGSRDHIAEVMQGYPQVKFVRQPNGGVSSARNLGVSHATGTWLAFVDSDDVWHRHKLRDQLHLARLHPDVPLGTAGSQSVSMDLLDFEPTVTEAGPPCALHPEFREVFRFPYLGLSGVFVRRDHFLAVGGFDAGLRCAEDVDFYLRLTYGRPGYWRLNYDAVYVRPVAGSLSSDSVSGYEQTLAVYQRFLQRRPEFATGERAVVRQTFAFLYLRYARSLLRTGRSRRETVAAAWQSFRNQPGAAALVVILRAVLLQDLLQWVKRQVQVRSDS
ncbi:glycosyltransferase family A protein [uncultured Aquabacterium sp.]|uniref:glycosyltransferase family A protein n=1 Tax=uncultured Aquabacterium sp. TaxID=158753 RepID=UPI0030CD95DF